MRNRLVGALLIVLSTRGVHAENELVAHAQAAMRAKQFAQAVADLRRVRASSAVAKDDPAVVGLLDDATAEWLVGIARSHDGASPRERLAVIARLRAEARAQNSALAEAKLLVMRASALSELDKETRDGDLTTRLAVAQEIESLAGAWPRRAELEAELDAALARVPEVGAYTGYARLALRSYHGVGSAPAVLPPEPPRWTVAAGSSACDHVVASVRSLLSAPGPDTVAVALEVTQCQPVEERGSRRESMTWYREEKQLRTVEGPTRKVSEWKRTPTTRRVCTPVYGESSTTNLGDRVLVTPSRKSESCRDETSYEDEMVTREVTDSRVEEITVRVPEVESVLVATRTTRLRASFRGTITAGPRSTPFEISLSASHDDTEYTSLHAGSSRFGDGRSVVGADVASQLRSALVKIAMPVVRAERLAVIQAALPSSSGVERFRLLSLQAREEGTPSTELVLAIAQPTGLSVVAVLEALRGERAAARPLPPAPTVALDLPPADESGTQALAASEERASLGAKMKGTSASSWVGLGRLSSDTADGWLVNLDARLWLMPSKYIFRPRRIGAFFDMAASVGVGRDTNVILGGTLAFGGFIGVRGDIVSLDALALVGIDALKQYNGDEMATPSDPGAPGASFAGYGAILRAALGNSSLAVEVRRQHRDDDPVPELWFAELRASRGGTFVGARAAIYEPLLDAGPRGTWVISLQLGVWAAAQDLRPTTKR